MIAYYDGNTLTFFFKVDKSQPATKFTCDLNIVVSYIAEWDVQFEETGLSINSPISINSNTVTQNLTIESHLSLWGSEYFNFSGDLYTIQNGGVYLVYDEDVNEYELKVFKKGQTVNKWQYSTGVLVIKFPNMIP